VKRFPCTKELNDGTATSITIDNTTTVTINSTNVKPAELLAGSGQLLI
ncbi:MAG: hypothetical protein ACI8U1_002308, partial [Rheinheimera aquimaris]